MLGTVWLELGTQWDLYTHPPIAASTGVATAVLLMPIGKASSLFQFAAHGIGNQLSAATSCWTI